MCVGKQILCDMLPYPALGTLRHRYCYSLSNLAIRDCSHLDRRNKLKYMQNHKASSAFERLGVDMAIDIWYLGVAIRKDDYKSL